MLHTRSPLYMGNEIYISYQNPFAFPATIESVEMSVDSASI